MRQMFFRLKAKQYNDPASSYCEYLYSKFNTIRYSENDGGMLYIYANNFMIEVWDTEDFNKDLINEMFDDINIPSLGSMNPTRVVSSQSDTVVEINLNEALKLKDPIMIFLERY